MNQTELALRRFIESRVDLDSSVEDEILSKFEYKCLKKNRCLSKKGTFFTNYVFVNSGHLRVFIRDDSNKETTLWIATNGVFFNDIIASKTKSTNEFYIQAIEDSEIAMISHADMEYFYNKYPNWQKFGRILWEDMIFGVTQKIISLLCTDANHRYSELLEQTDLVKSVPLHQLASYIGITPSSLSRIRKNKLK